MLKNILAIITVGAITMCLIFAMSYALASDSMYAGTLDEPRYMDIVQVTNGFYAGYEGQIIKTTGGGYLVALKIPDAEFGTRIHDYHIIYSEIASTNLKLISKAKRTP